MFFLYIVSALILLVPLSRHSIDIFTVVDDNGVPRFSRFARFEGLSRLRAIHESRVGFAMHDGRSLPSVLNWRTGSVTNLQPQPGLNVSIVYNFKILSYLTPILNVGRCHIHGIL